jgi:hypothetical protein
MAAAVQRLAAVVSPRTQAPCRMIAPAPRKPMPVTMPAAIRLGSTVPCAASPGSPEKPKIETTVKRADPIATRRCVRRPAG